MRNETRNESKKSNHNGTTTRRKRGRSDTRVGFCNLKSGISDSRKASRLRLAILALAALLLLPCLTARAEWPTWDGLPAWIRRGHLRWTQAGAADHPQADALAAQGMTLLWGGYGSNDPAQIAYMRERDIHASVYICSTSIFGNPKDADSIFAQYPPLLNATVLEPDGTRRVIYDHPWDREGTTWRFAGCRLSPEWLTYQKNRMTFYALGGQPFPNDPVYSKMKGDPAPSMDVFFFDNPFFLKCYCPRCREAWAKYCTDRFGVLVPDGERSPDERIRNAWDTFWLEANVEYRSQLQAYAAAMTPPHYVAPNYVYGYPDLIYLMQHSAPDIVLIELGGGGERPWGHSEFPYKLALAATGGKAMANIWCFPAARPRPELRRIVRPLLWGAGLRSGYLTEAESIACLATYIHGPGEESLGRFQTKYMRLYADAQPAAEVALVYSVPTELWRRRVWRVDLLDFLGPHWWIGMDYTPSAHVKHLADRLSELGIPYDVLVESELTREQLDHYRCVILPDVQCLEPEQARALLGFVRSGGSAIISENLGIRDREGNRLSRSEARALGGPLSTADRLVSIPPSETALEAFLPDGFSGRIESLPSRAKTVVPRATLRLSEQTLPAPADPCDVKMQYFDSSTGTGATTLALDGKPLGTWPLDYQSDEFHWSVKSGVTLRPGGALEIGGAPDGSEPYRVQEIRLQRPAETVGLGRGKAIFVPDRLTELPLDALHSYVKAAGGTRRQWATADPEEDVFVNVLRPKGSKVLAFHIVNSSSSDRHHAALLDHPACVAKRTLALSAEARQKITKPVVSLLGFTPYWTQTYMAREVAGQPFTGKSQTAAFVVVRLNGTEIGRLPLGTIEDGWTNVRFDRALLRERNSVEVRVEGDVGFRRSFFGLLIDPAARDGSSEWTPPPWPSHAKQAADDLSPYEGVQQGAYMIAVRDQDDAAALPAYAPAHTPIRDLRLVMREHRWGRPDAIYLRPGGVKQETLAVASTREGYVISVPEVDGYGVVLVGNSRREITRLLPME